MTEDDEVLDDARATALFHNALIDGGIEHGDAVPITTHYLSLRKAAAHLAANQNLPSIRGPFS